MNIDITELMSHEIIQILTNFPQGKLVTKQDRIFWDSVSFEPVMRPPQGVVRNSDPRQPPRGPTQGQQIGQRFEKMADVLGSMVC